MQRVESFSRRTLQILPGVNIRILTVAVILTSIFIGLLAVVQFSTPDLVGTDAYYHLRFAEIMRTEGLRPAFPWLPLSILNPREFSDHHFLFHVALMPFTTGDLQLGGKWASITFSSIAFLSIWWLLRNQRVPYAGLWAIGLLGVSEAFIYRMSMVRAQSLSLAVLAIGLHWMLTGKHTRLFPLAFLYVWLYDAFPLLLLVSGAYVAALWIIERRLDLRPLAFAIAGTMAGLVINPYFPHNVIFFYRHLLPKIGQAETIRVGNEWYPYETAQLLENSPMAFLAFLAGVLALGLKGQRMDLRTATTLLAAILFGTLLFQSRRFIEYFPAFSLIFASMAWAPILKNYSELIPGEEEGNLRATNGWGRFLKPISWNRWLPITALLLIVLPSTWFTLKASQSSVQQSKPFRLYADASAWLEKNTPAGSRVFQTDWDDFPRLFFYNTHNTYLIGLDATYMHLYNPDLYDLWVKISQGESESLSEVIYSRFGAQFVFTDLQHESFLRKAREDPNLEEIYRDKEAAIFSVKH